MPWGTDCLGSRAPGPPFPAREIPHLTRTFIVGPAGIELAASASSEHLGESRRIFGCPVFPVQMRRCLPTMKRSGTAGDCPGRDPWPGTSIQRCWPKGQAVQRENQNRWAEEWAVGHRAGFSERRPSFRFGRSGVEWETRSIDSFRCCPSAVDKTWGARPRRTLPSADSALLRRPRVLTEPRDLRSAICETQPEHQAGRDRPHWYRARTPPVPFGRDRLQ